MADKCQTTWTVDCDFYDRWIGSVQFWHEKLGPSRERGWVFTGSMFHWCWYDDMKTIIWWLNQYGCKNITARESYKPLKSLGVCEACSSRSKEHSNGDLRLFAQCYATALEQHNPASPTLPGLGHMDHSNPSSWPKEAMSWSSDVFQHSTGTWTHTGPTVHDRWILAICRVSSLPTDRWPGDVSALKTRMSRELWESAVIFKDTIWAYR